MYQGFIGFTGFIEDPVYGVGIPRHQFRPWHYAPEGCLKGYYLVCNDRQGFLNYSFEIA